MVRVVQCLIRQMHESVSLPLCLLGQQYAESVNIIDRLLRRAISQMFAYQVVKRHHRIYVIVLMNIIK